MSHKTNNSVEFMNGFPYIKSEVSINANILSMDGNTDYTDSSNLKLVEDYANTYLQTNINSYLYKTSKEFKSDIAGFGKYAKKYYSTIEDWKKSDWLDNYQNTFFDVSVNTNVYGSYLFNKM